MRLGGIHTEPKRTYCNTHTLPYGNGPTGIPLADHLSRVWVSHGWNFTVCTCRISDKMCDVSAAQGCLCVVSIKVCNAAVTLFTHSCVFIRVALGLQVLDLSVEVFVNEWFCQCVHTFSLKLMQTITPVHCKKWFFKVVEKKQRLLVIICLWNLQFKDSNHTVNAGLPALIRTLILPYIQWKLFRYDAQHSVTLFHL